MERVWIGDTESDGLLPDATIIWCGVFKNFDTGEVRKFYPGSHDDYISAMYRFLDNETDVLVMHNGTGHDWPLMRKLHGYEYSGKRVDTLLISRSQSPDRRSPSNCPNKYAPHSVEAWGYRLDRGKPEHNDWSKFSLEMLHRCTEDTEIQYGIFKSLLSEGKGFTWRQAHILTQQLFDRLQRSEEYGWLVDRPHIEKSIATLDRWIGLIDKVIVPSLPMVIEIDEVKVNGEYKYVSKPFKKDGKHTEQVVKWANGLDYTCVGGPFSRVKFRPVNLDSNKETKDYLLNEGWEPKEWNYNDEGERTSPKLSKDDPFEGINGKLGRLVARRVQCRHRRSTLVGWLNSIRADGRIPSVVTGLTYTGRAKHASIVNVPRAGSFFGKWMRKVFIAKPGWVLVGTDSDANHARQLAARMGDDEFIFAVTQGKKEDGTDMHSMNKKKIGPICKTRDQAKIFFYAFLLGAQAKRLSQVFLSSVADAGQARENFLANLPKLKEVIDKLTDEWKTHAKKRYNQRFNKLEYYNGWFSGLDGRPIFCEYEKDVLGYALQSDESIQMARAYVVFHEWMEQAGYVWGLDYGTVCWYHDEWTVECRKEIAHEVGKLAAKAIEWAGEYYGIKCPHKGNYQIGNNWAEIH
jgi:DNA polymerase-1